MAHVAKTWSTDDLCAFLVRIDLPGLVATWAQPNNIDGIMLLDLIETGSLDATLGDPPNNLLPHRWRAQYTHALGGVAGAQRQRNIFYLRIDL